MSKQSTQQQPASPHAKVLEALGYTPKTLAIDLDIPASKARRFLRGDSELFCSEAKALCDLLQMPMDILFGDIKPGEIRAGQLGHKAKIEAAHKQQEEEDTRQQALYQCQTPAEHCEYLAKVFANTFQNLAKKYDFALRDLLARIAEIQSKESVCQ